MQLDITLESKDFWAFSHIAETGRKKNKTYQSAINSLFWIAMGFLGMHLILTGVALDFSVWRWAKGPGIIVVLIGLSVYLPLRHTRKIFEPVPNGNTLGRRNYDFSPDGIDVSHEHFSSQYQWSSIVDFVESDNYFFLFIDSTAAFIIPKRAFETAEELASFEKLVVETSGLQVHTID